MYSCMQEDGGGYMCGKIRPFDLNIWKYVTFLKNKIIARTLFEGS